MDFVNLLAPRSRDRRHRGSHALSRFRNLFLNFGTLTSYSVKSPDSHAKLLGHGPPT